MIVYRNRNGLTAQVEWKYQLVDSGKGVMGRERRKREEREREKGLFVVLRGGLSTKDHNVRRM
jgi:hypothetical protein